MSASAVAQWEHPHGTQPSLHSLVRIVEVTGVSIEWLITGRSRRAGPAHPATSEVPAISLEVYARSIHEETLLERFRQIPLQRRPLLIALAEEFAAPRTIKTRKPR